MTSQPASRFNFHLDLRVDDAHVYSVRSPSVDVGTYVVELGEALQRVARFVDLDMSLPVEDRQGEDAIPADLQARVRAVAERAPEILRTDMFRAYLGDTLDQMKADGMPFEVVKLAAATIGMWVQTDRDTALQFWNSGGRVRDPRKAPADRKAKQTPRSSGA